MVLYIFAILHFFPDILSQEFDPMIYTSLSGVENVIPYPIHTDVAVGCRLLRLTYSKITIKNFLLHRNMTLTEFIMTVHAFKKWQKNIFTCNFFMTSKALILIV